MYTVKMGKAMFFIAFLLFMGMLVGFFQQQLDTRYNPSLQVLDNAQGIPEVLLQRNYYGHYVTEGRINQQDVVFMLDTGATMVAVPESMMVKLGLQKGRALQISTANGISKAWRTQLEALEIGPIKLFKVRAIIVPNLDDILLGMSVLKQLDFSQQGSLMILRQARRGT